MESNAASVALAFAMRAMCRAPLVGRGNFVVSFGSSGLIAVADDTGRDVGTGRTTIGVSVPAGASPSLADGPSPIGRGNAQSAALSTIFRLPVPGGFELLLPYWTARSGKPSPLKSALTICCGVFPMGMVKATTKLPRHRCP